MRQEIRMCPLKFFCYLKYLGHFIQSGFSLIVYTVFVNKKVIAMYYLFNLLLFLCSIIDWKFLICIYRPVMNKVFKIYILKSIYYFVKVKMLFKYQLSNVQVKYHITLSFWVHHLSCNIIWTTQFGDFYINLISTCVKFVGIKLSKVQKYRSNSMILSNRSYFIRFNTDIWLPLVCLNFLHF